MWIQQQQGGEEKWISEHDQFQFHKMKQQCPVRLQTVKNGMRLHIRSVDQPVHKFATAIDHIESQPLHCEICDDDMNVEEDETELVEDIPSRLFGNTFVKKTSL
jgi:hypothetical protein